MSNKNAVVNSEESNEIENFDLEELEKNLREDLDMKFSDLEAIDKEREKIGNNEQLADVVGKMVWEQFVNQISAQAGQDFMKDNNDLKLDLRNDSHIQTTENFENGKIAKHNSNIDYQERHDSFRSRHQLDDLGNIKTRLEKRSEKEVIVLTKNARDDFDKGRSQGSNQMHKDHTVPTAELNRDTRVNAYLSREEQVGFANSEFNLHDLDASANQSKGDSAAKDWLKSERDGKKPSERFDIDEKEILKNDKIARDELEKRVEKGEQEAIDTGKESRKKEAKNVSGKAVKAAVMLLLSEFMKEVLQKLVIWLKSKNKKLITFKASFKEALKSFLSKLNQHMKTAGNVISSTIISAIVGPIFNVFKKFWSLLKTGYSSMRDAIKYLNDPKNSHEPYSIKLLKAGEIVVAGLSAVGAVLLGEVIEKALMSIPLFAIEIPLLGSIANIFGIFAGGLVSGVIGAILINKIEGLVRKKQLSEISKKQIDKGNEILENQIHINIVREEKLDHTKNTVQKEISERHAWAKNEINTSMKAIFGDNPEKSLEDFEKVFTEDIVDMNEKKKSKNQKNLDDIDEMLNDLLK